MLVGEHRPAAERIRKEKRDGGTGSPSRDRTSFVRLNLYKRTSYPGAGRVAIACCSGTREGKPNYRTTMAAEAIVADGRERDVSPPYELYPLATALSRPTPPRLYANKFLWEYRGGTATDTLFCFTSTVG